MKLKEFLTKNDFFRKLDVSFLQEQRKMEFVLAQELKKPREDMELRDLRVGNSNLRDINIIYICLLLECSN
jgi:hypothetical protein